MSKTMSSTVMFLGELNLTFVKEYGMNGCSNERFTSGDWVEKWKHTRKKRYSVQVRLGINGEVLYNHLENRKYVITNETSIVLIGVCGEKYAMSVEYLKENFKRTDGSCITDDYLRSLKPFRYVKLFRNTDDVYKDGKTQYTNYALFVRSAIYHNIPIKMNDGILVFANAEGIHHGKGDYLVCGVKDCKPDFSNIKVVNGEVFAKTYSMIGLSKERG